MTITKIRDFFANLKEVSEIIIKLPVGLLNDDSLPEENPPAGYISLGVESNQLKWLNEIGEKGLVLSGEPLVSNSYFPSGW